MTYYFLPTGMATIERPTIPSVDEEVEEVYFAGRIIKWNN